jgi:hypothetical protein
MLTDHVSDLGASLRRILDAADNDGLLKPR